MKQALLAVLLVLLASTVCAQIPSAEAGVAQVRELLALSGADKQYEETLSRTMDDIRADFGQGFVDAVKDKTLDPAKQQQAQAIAERHMNEALKDYRETIGQIMSYERLVNEVYAPLYLKHFTPAELADVIAFFKSPSGRKFAAAAPQLVQDSMRAVSARYMPQLNRRMNQLMRERMQKMAEEIGKL
jgi:hypothetical protein